MSSVFDSQEGVVSFFWDSQFASRFLQVEQVIEIQEVYNNDRMIKSLSTVGSGVNDE